MNIPLGTGVADGGRLREVIAEPLESEPMTTPEYATPFENARGVKISEGGDPGGAGGRQLDPLQLNPGLQAHVEPVASRTWPAGHRRGFAAEFVPEPLIGHEVAARSACHTTLLFEALVDIGVAGQSLAWANSKSHLAPMSAEQVWQEPEKLMGRPSASAPE